MVVARLSAASSKNLVQFASFLLASMFCMFSMSPASRAAEPSKGGGEAGDIRLLGSWMLVRTLVVGSYSAGAVKTAGKYVRCYAEWHFSKDGTAAVTVSYRFKEVRKDLKWRTFIRDGIHLLELLDGEETFLMARYEMKKDELWLAISLDPKAVKTDPPKTFDPEKESEALFVVLRRPPQKK